MGRFTENVALIVALVLYIGTVLSLSLLTETSIFVVFVATMPILLYLIAFFYLVKIDPHMGLLWVLPLVFPIIFLLIWYSKTLYVLNMTDGPTVAVINILISYAINIFILLIMGFGRREPREKRVAHQTSHVVHHVHSGAVPEHNELRKELDDARMLLHDTKSRLDEAHTKLAATKAELDETKNVLQENKNIINEAKNIIINKENFTVNLRGIEDKCKAINFVIGRVYSDKKGASPKIRAGLRIDSELYNSFSEITSDFKDEQATKLFNLLKKIHDRLGRLEMREKDLLTIGDAKLPVARTADGSDRVIDVLINNDKDPVADYHADAKEVCEKVMAYLTEQYVTHHKIINAANKKDSDPDVDSGAYSDDSPDFDDSGVDSEALSEDHKD